MESICSSCNSQPAVPLGSQKKSKSHLLTLPIVQACCLLSVACHNQQDTHVPPACSEFGSSLIPAPVCLYMSCACLNSNRCRVWGEQGEKGTDYVHSGSLLCVEDPKSHVSFVERWDSTIRQNGG